MEVNTVLIMPYLYNKHVYCNNYIAWFGIWKWNSPSYCTM